MKLAAVLLVIFLIFIPVNAYSIWNDLHWAGMGSLFVFASDGSKNPSAIIPTLGFSVAWPLNDFLRIEFTEDVYFTNYEFDTERGFPIACSPENRSAFVIGFVTAFQVTGHFPIGHNGTAIRVYGGPAADLRIAVLAFGLHPTDTEGPIDKNAQLQTDAIRKMFWGDARWFMPVFGTGMDFPLNDNFLIGFDIRTWFPVYKLWTNDNIPAIDGWRFGAGLRITPRKL